ncbi:hypothetical protein YC2023_063261 [Brassica napus]
MKRESIYRFSFFFCILLPAVTDWLLLTLNKHSVHFSQVSLQLKLSFNLLQLFGLQVELLIHIGKLLARFFNLGKIQLQIFLP